MDVFLTFDVEIWCDGWSDLDRKFPDAFRRYVYGRSRHGDCALPLTLRILQDHGLRGTFFVEPLFAMRFGLEPLREVVGLLLSAKQDVQLHLHPEWVDEASPPLLPAATSKRPNLSQYSLDEQIALLRLGKGLLESAGAVPPCAFRAGNYACSRETLTALNVAGLRFDSSVNPSRPWSGSDLSLDERGQRILDIDGIVEYPITVFFDRPRHLRQVQVGSSSLAEMTYLLRRAAEQPRNAFVIVSHNFEMLVPGSSECDRMVVRRFVGLCDYLARRRETCPTRIFPAADGVPDKAEPPALKSAIWRTAMRTLEQAYRLVNP